MIQNLKKKEDRTIAILGAGLAGLSCAIRLTELGFKNIVIIEKEPYAGGLATSLHFKGHTSDLGPHRIHSEVKEVLQFLEKWCGDLLIRCTRKSHLYLHGKFLPYPPDFRNTLRHFGLIDMGRFAGSFFWTKISRLLFPPPSQNYETRMEQAFGCALYRAIIKPYTEKTWGMAAKNLSGDVAKARISAGGLSSLAKRLFLKEQKGKETSLREFLYIKGGIENLGIHFKTLLESKGVRFLFKSTVAGINITGDSSMEIIHRQEGVEKVLDADFCFSTIPLPDLVSMLKGTIPEGGIHQAANSLEYLSMILVFTRIGKGRISDDTWLYFPQKDIIFNRGYEAKNFDQGLGPDKESLICLEITCRKGDEVWNAADETVGKRACEDLVKTGLVKEEEILDARIARITHAYPVYDLEYRAKLDRIWDYLKEIPILITLGRQGLFHHNNMDHSIYEGITAAQYLSEKENPPSDWYRDEGRFRKLRIVD